MSSPVGKIDPAERSNCAAQSIHSVHGLQKPDRHLVPDPGNSSACYLKCQCRDLIGRRIIENADFVYAAANRIKRGREVFQTGVIDSAQGGSLAGVSSQQSAPRHPLEMKFKGVERDINHRHAKARRFRELRLIESDLAAQRGFDGEGLASCNAPLNKPLELAVDLGANRHRDAAIQAAIQLRRPILHLELLSGIMLLQPFRHLAARRVARTQNQHMFPVTRKD